MPAFVVSETGESLFPRVCVYCKTKLKLTETKTDIYCPNSKCPGVSFERLDRFFKKVKVDGLSTKSIFKLAQAGIDSPLKVFTVDPKEIEKIEGFTLAGAKKLKAKITEVSKKASLDIVMSASGIFQNSNFGIGDSRCEIIVKTLGKAGIEKGSVSDIQDKLLREEGLGREIINLFIDKLPEFREFMTGLSTVMNFDPSKGMKSAKLAGKAFAFSEFRDKDLETLIKENGGRVTNSVSKNTFALFTESRTSGKAQDAKAANEKAGKEVVKIVSPQNAEKFLFNLIGE